MKTAPVEKSDGAAAGPHELWEALAKYHPGEGGETFHEVYSAGFWHDEGNSEDRFLMLTRKDGEDPKPREPDLILKWAKKESPYVVGLEWPRLG